MTPTPPEREGAGEVLDGLPADLARVLRDHSIIVAQDQAVWELLASWRNAPSNTASGDPPAEGAPR